MRPGIKSTSHAFERYVAQQQERAATNDFLEFWCGHPRRLDNIVVPSPSIRKRWGLFGAWIDRWYRQGGGEP